VAAPSCTKQAVQTSAVQMCHALTRCSSAEQPECHVCNAAMLQATGHQLLHASCVPALCHLLHNSSCCQCLGCSAGTANTPRRAVLAAPCRCLPAWLVCLQTILSIVMIFHHTDCYGGSTIVCMPMGCYRDLSAGSADTGGDSQNPRLGIIMLSTLTAGGPVQRLVQ
jgi:hypothetical protein